MMWSTSNKYLLRISVHFVRYRQINIASSTENILKNQNLSSTDLQPSRDRQPKLIKVSLLGMPNAGKSTIINSLTKRHVCPTSMKVHTTARNAQAICNSGNTQIVFIDTPGVLSPGCVKKYNKPQNNNIILNALKFADIIGITLDVTNKFNRSTIQPSILELLQHLTKDIPFVLIFNKVDKVKHKDVFLDYIKTLTTNAKLPVFKEIFMVSGLTGDGIDDLRDYLISIAKPRPWMYEKAEFTDQAFEKITEDTLRAKLLDALPEEIPYSLNVRVIDLKYRSDGSIVALIEVLCPNSRVLRQVVKRGRLRTVCQLTQDALRNAFRNSVLVRVSCNVVSR